jgi:hypothetical protein
MVFSRTVRMLAALSLLGCLSGCGIPDLVAHGVKEIEKSNRSGGQSSASSQPAQAQPQYQSRTEEEPPPPSAPAAARRSSVTVEELKP